MDKTFIMLKAEKNIEFVNRIYIPLLNVISEPTVSIISTEKIKLQMDTPTLTSTYNPAATGGTMVIETHFGEIEYAVALSEFCPKVT